MCGKKASAESKSKRKRRHPLRRSREPSVVVFPEPTSLWQREIDIRLRSSVSPHRDEKWVLAALALAWKAFRAWCNVAHPGDLEVAMITLFVKAMNDICAALLLCRSGYYLPAWPLIRGCVEATELMEYFRRHPDRLIEWLEKDPDFDHTGWIRWKLPASQLRKQFYDTVNEIIHANWREAHLFSTPGEITGGRRLYVGPFELAMEQKNPIAMLAGIIAYPLREFYHLCADLVSQEWKALVEDLDSLTNYPFSAKMGRGSREVTPRLASWMESLGY